MILLMIMIISKVLQIIFLFSSQVLKVLVVRINSVDSELDANSLIQLIQEAVVNVTVQTSVKVTFRGVTEICESNFVTCRFLTTF